MNFPNAMRIDEHISNKAMDLLNNQKGDQAISMLENYTKMPGYKNNYTINIALGCIYGACKRHRKALNKFQELQKKNKKDITLLLNMAMAHKGLKQYNKSLEYLRIAYDIIEKSQQKLETERITSGKDTPQFQQDVITKDTILNNYIHIFAEKNNVDLKKDLNLKIIIDTDGSYLIEDKDCEHFFMSGETVFEAVEEVIIDYIDTYELCLEYPKRSDHINEQFKHVKRIIKFNDR